MSTELFLLQRYKTEEKHTILAHKMTTRDNQQPKVMSPVGNEVNSIPGIKNNIVTWKFSLNISEVSTEY